jgi:nicotinic acid mononucleotide adenylyltransferase
MSDPAAAGAPQSAIKAYYTIGRFQPPTLGHVRMINTMLELAKGKPVYVFVSRDNSLVEPGVKVEYFTKMLTREKVFPANLTFINTATCTPSPCGGPTYAYKFLTSDKNDIEKQYTGNDLMLVVGGDRKDDFDPQKAKMWGFVEDSSKLPSMHVLQREEGTGAASYSSTKARRAVGRGGWEKLKRFLTDGKNAITDDDVKRMATILLEKKANWPEDKDPEGPIEGGGEDDSVLGDLDGGRRRRRTRRVKRSKASSKALYRRGSRSRNGSSRTNRSSYALPGY